MDYEVEVCRDGNMSSVLYGADRNGAKGGRLIRSHRGTDFTAYTGRSSSTRKWSGVEMRRYRLAIYEKSEDADKWPSMG